MANVEIITEEGIRGTVPSSVKVNGYDVPDIVDATIQVTPDGMITTIRVRTEDFSTKKLIG